MKREDFQKSYKGKQTDLFEIESPKGYRLQLTNYGCRWVGLWVKDKNDEFVDIVLGYDTIADYIADDTNQGALVGRVANRIANSEFDLDGKTYHLTRNVAGVHHLHGGIEGFASAVWEVVSYSKSSISLSHTSLDGDQGYPGTLKVTATLSWTEDDILQTQITAETDQTTVTNMTFHPYFNLLGAGTATINNQEIKIPAGRILEFGEGAVATGKYLSVTDTPFDFREFRQVDFEAVMQTQWGQEGEGVDHFYVLDNYEGKLQNVATAKANNGIEMQIWSEQPGVQCYTSNFLDAKGKDGKQYPKYSAFCLETQIHPNAPRIAHFPSVRLEPGEVYKAHTEYHFL